MDRWDVIGDFLEQSGEPEMADDIRCRTIDLSSGVKSASIYESFPTESSHHGPFLLIRYDRDCHLIAPIVGFEERDGVARFFLTIAEEHPAFVAVPKPRLRTKFYGVEYFYAGIGNLPMPAMPEHLTVPRSQRR